MTFEEANLRISNWPAKDVPEDLIRQLVEKSYQEHVKDLDVKSDGGGRFATIASYKTWATGKNRTVYLLLNPENDVGGIVWFSEKKSELIDDKYDLTFGIRIYKDYLGQGLAKPLMKETHDDIKKKYPGRAIWLATDDDNIPALKAYESFGYVHLAKDGKRIIMGLEP